MRKTYSHKNIPPLSIFCHSMYDINYYILSDISIAVDSSEFDAGPWSEELGLWRHLVVIMEHLCNADSEL